MGGIRGRERGYLATRGAQNFYERKMFSVGWMTAREKCRSCTRARVVYVKFRRILYIYRNSCYCSTKCYRKSFI